jgi:hypothetical protein
MLYLTFKINNPWSNRFANLFCQSGLLTKNKAWEIQLMKSSDIVFCQFEFSTKKDHAGLYVQLGLIGFNLAGQIYDTRHWDYTQSKWEEYNDTTR